MNSPSNQPRIQPDSDQTQCRACKRHNNQQTPKVFLANSIGSYWFLIYPVQSHFPNRSPDWFLVQLIGSIQTTLVATNVPNKLEGAIHQAKCTYITTSTLSHTNLVCSRDKSRSLN
uniref:Uncharacterized protein n=1 Tax=Gossypium raimondii TaxID=29730 RepID=A0A0D2QGU0_GOSRA|nr:hypothetical protein B456_003G072500 [Gossypium raimondii]